MEQGPIIEKTKKVIVVVGRMGHGKSSLCKMLVADEQKNRIVALADFQNVTVKSQLFPAEKISKELNFECFILDTPGLDSQQSVSLILAQIEDFIVAQRLEVIGIAYVLDIHAGRQKNVKNEGYIVPFLNRLKLNYECKRNITFCVLSKFDRHYDQQQANKKLSIGYERMFRESGYQYVWNRRIQWMSEPAEDTERFNIGIRNIHRQRYNQQTIMMYQFLRQNIQQPIRYCSFQKYLSDLEQFSALFQKILIQSHPYKQTQIIEISFEINAQEVENKKYPKIDKPVAMICIGKILNISGAIAYAYTTGTLEAVSINIIDASLYALGFGASLLTIQMIKRYFTSQKLLQAQQPSLIKLFKSKILEKIMKGMQNYLLKMMTIKGSQLNIDYSKIYKKIEVELDGKREQCKIIIGKGINKIKLKKGKNKIIFTVESPTIIEYDKILKKMKFQKYLPL